MKTIQIQNDLQQIRTATEFLRRELNARKVPKKEGIRCVLAAEEILSTLVEHSTESISLSVAGFLGSAEISFSAKGSEFSASELEEKLFFNQLDSENVFKPISTLFMNALKMIVAPLVFFSIASSIADFSDIKALVGIIPLVVFCSMANMMISLDLSHLLNVASWVPAESVSLIMGMYPIASMMNVCMNVTGDAVATAVIARHEGLFDLQKYNNT